MPFSFFLLLLFVGVFGVQAEFTERGGRQRKLHCMHRPGREGGGEREVEGGREVGGEKKPSLRHVKLPLMPQAIVSNFFLFLFVLSPLLITHAVKGKSRVKGRTPA